LNTDLGDSPARGRIPVLVPRLRVPSSQSGQMPPEPSDASDDLSKEGPRQVGFGKLEDEAPDIPEETPGLEEPLLEARQ